MTKECYIVAGGPSLTGFNWTLLDDKFVIAINRSYEVLPNANILYFTDTAFWETHRESMKKHGGKIIRGATRLGITEDSSVEEYLLTGPMGIETTPGRLRHGSNSTYAAINLALVHLRFDIVYVLGLDMKWSKHTDHVQTHWHSGHGRLDPEGAYEHMKQCFDMMSRVLTTQFPSKRVINVNNDTALTAFPVIPYQTVFGDACFNK